MPTELGLSLRDYFAAKALSHALDLYAATSKANINFATAKAYEMADAMLAERAK